MGGAARIYTFYISPQDREISVPISWRAAFLYKICVPVFLKFKGCGNAKPGTRTPISANVDISLLVYQASCRLLHIAAGLLMRPFLLMLMFLS